MQASSQNLNLTSDVGMMNTPIESQAVNQDLQAQNFRLSKKVGELTQALDMMLKKAESGQFGGRGGGANEQ